ncbi:MAG: prepilin-type N-terminal cleavage/methylation domain-containing protein [Deltaproteobacteria bacterium]|nr:prepilin-type N-terminal cleavage/methylation domain-containing protein [Deltaproteobacteria bacterium]
MRNQRGFTLLEMMIVCSILPILFAAAGSLYVESRVAGARIEAQLRLQREASLIAEFMTRDLRSDTQAASTLVAPDSAGDRSEISIPIGGKKARYLSTGTTLTRHVDGEDPVTLSRRVRHLSIKPDGDAFQIDLELEHPILPGREVRFQRTLKVVHR